MRTDKTLEQVRRFFDLSGKSAVVTGGSGGLGRAVARGLAAFGADVAVTARTTAALEETAAEIRDTGSKVVPISCDVSDAASVDAMMAEAVKELGKVDILVTGAGIAYRQPAEEMDVAQWQKVMDVNVKGTFLCCQAVAKHMIARGEGGKIVTVSSIRGSQGHPAGYSAYGTSKGAIHLLTRQLACEWAKYKIHVNSIAPCIFWTPLTEPILRDPEMYKLFMTRIPIGRAAEPDDFIGAAVYLASDASAMVTGHIL
ncbi:MAG: glucose 1-dehydrogenase, partial [Deltaproteobacteria bacterium]|nr:glucose 1-dehydrogenase [Deltaproteobacteria bacterium]